MAIAAKKNNIASLAIAIPIALISAALARLLADSTVLICPAETFAFGPTRDGITDFSFVIAAGPPFVIVANIASAFLPEQNSFSYLREHLQNRKIWLATVSIVSVCILMSWTVSGSQFCLSQSKVLHRTFPWQTFRKYKWNDVVDLSVECSMQHGKPSPTYLMSMKDGTMVDAAYADNFWEALSQIKRHLASGSFKFETGGIQSSCDPEHAALLRQKP